MSPENFLGDVFLSRFPVSKNHIESTRVRWVVQKKLSEHVILGYFKAILRLFWPILGGFGPVLGGVLGLF